MILFSEVSTAQWNANTGHRVHAITAIVLGGTSLLGGEGAVWRAALGRALPEDDRQRLQPARNDAAMAVRHPGRHPGGRGLARRLVAAQACVITHACAALRDRADHGCACERIAWVRDARRAIRARGLHCLALSDGRHRGRAPRCAGAHSRLLGLDDQGTAERSILRRRVHRRSDLSLSLAARTHEWRRTRIVAVLAFTLTSLALLVTLRNLGQFVFGQAA